MNENQSLSKTLKTRHLTMISIGASIGTGIFLGSGSAIHNAGPGGALIGFGIIGIMLYFVLTSLAEMTAFMPVSDSFGTYSSRFVSTSFGFAVSWNYWYSWTVTIASEFAGVVLLLKYWLPDANWFVFSILSATILLCLNLLSVKGYGEVEFWFALIKVCTIVAFVLFSLGAILGIVGGEAIGLRNFTIDNGPFHGGFLTIFGVLMIAGFSFQGTELIGVSAGESENPAKSVPLAIKQIFWRIFWFYMLAILVIGLVIPYSTASLASDSIAMSPFTLVFDRVGIAFAASAVNAIILTSVLSSGNSMLYASTRILWNLAMDGKAPKYLKKLNKRKIPINSLITTIIFTYVVYLVSLIGSGEAFNWLLAASGLAGFITWISVFVSHFRFRKAFVLQGNKMNDLPYRAKFYPYGQIFAFIISMIILIFQGFGYFTEGAIDWTGVIATYIGLPIFFLFWIGYKVVKKPSKVDLTKCDFSVEK
jgi:amino acid permease